MNSKIITNIKKHKTTIMRIAFWAWVIGFTSLTLYNIDVEHKERERQILEHQRKIDEIDKKISDIHTEVQQISQFVATEQTEIEDESKEIETPTQESEVKRERDTEETNRGSGRIMHVTCTAYTAGDGMTPGTVMANGEKVHYGAVA